MSRTGVNASTRHWVFVRLTPNPTTYPRVRKIDSLITREQLQAVNPLRVQDFLQVGDQPRYEGRAAENFKQNGNNGCDCHNFPFMVQMDVALAANHWPSSIKNMTQSGALLINIARKIALQTVTSRT